jgi:hypothetical protein
VLLSNFFLSLLMMLVTKLAKLDLLHLRHQQFHLCFPACSDQFRPFIPLVFHPRLPPFSPQLLFQLELSPLPRSKPFQIN